MARTITMREAINEALDQEMARDPSVVLMGVDIVGGAGSPGEDDAWGGVLGVTKGLYAKYGRERLLDTPLSESAYIGAAIGAATCGLRPVAELMFIDFMGVCFDQIYNQAAKFRYMFGGKAETPVTIRAMVGAGFRAAAQHSQMLTPIFTHIPGLKVVCPSNPYDAKGLLIQSIRELKARLEQLRLDAERAERMADFEAAARLKYGEVPKVQKELEAKNTELVALQKEHRLLKEEVDEEDIAKIV